MPTEDIDQSLERHDHTEGQLSKWQSALKIIGDVFVSVLRTTDRWENRSTGNHRQKDSINSISNYLFRSISAHFLWQN